MPRTAVNVPTRTKILGETRARRGRDSGHKKSR